VVIYHNRTRLPAQIEAATGVQYVEKGTLLREADHLIVVVPYSQASRHAIGAQELSQMKSTATLTNIARGDGHLHSAKYGVTELLAYRSRASSGLQRRLTIDRPNPTTNRSPCSAGAS
jgi:hypothetical protein